MVRRGVGAGFDGVCGLASWVCLADLRNVCLCLIADHSAFQVEMLSRSSASIFLGICTSTAFIWICRFNMSISASSRSRSLHSLVSSEQRLGVYLAMARHLQFCYSCF